MRSLPRPPMAALACLLAVMLAPPLATGGQWTATAAATQLAFTVQTVDSPWAFGSMGDRSMRLDRAGRPHCAGGTGRLWYGYHDGTAWHVEPVDEAPGAASYVALALDNNDNPWISYAFGGDDEGGGKLKVAHRVGGTWHTDTVDAGPDLWVWNTSIACDRSGRPHVSYYNEAWASGGVLKYATWNGVSWSVTAVIGAGISWDYLGFEYLFYFHPGGTSIALDPAGRPCIAFYVFQWLALGFASWNGSAWDFEYADGAHNGQFCSLAFDATGAPAIGYHDAQSSLLKYARKGAAGWSTEWVDHSHQYSSHDTSLAFDQAGRPAISYAYDEGGAHEVRVARWDGAAWAIQTVEAGARAACTSLAVDPTGAPQLTYTTADLRHARWNGAAWDVETVAPSGRIGAGASLALDGAGRPHVVYCELAHDRLRYARWDGAAWQLEDVDAAVCDSLYEVPAAIALDGSGNPHIAYATPGATDQTLRHARRVGGVWQGESVRTAKAFADLSLALDGAGAPQLVYCERDAGVKHSYWTGTAWRHRTFDADGGGPSLALDASGKAHIACVNGTDDVVKYGRWNGTSFVRETVGAASGTAPVSLRLDAAGNPAIAFTRGKESEQLLLARKTGSSWAIQTAFESGSFNFIQSLSLALDPAGNPGIAARCWGTGLHYARLAGGAWVAHGVDTLNKATDGVSHAIGADGKALIAYGSGKLSALMLATQVDAETGGMRRHLPRR